MKKNMSNADRIVRLVLVAIFSALYFTNLVTGVIGLTLMVISAIFLLTSIVRFCPIYAIFGLSTCEVEKT